MQSISSGRSSFGGGGAATTLSVAGVLVDGVVVDGVVVAGVDVDGVVVEGVDVDGVVVEGVVCKRCRCVLTPVVSNDSDDVRVGARIDRRRMRREIMCFLGDMAIVEPALPLPLCGALF